MDGPESNPARRPPTAAELHQESLNIRRLQFLVGLVMNVISQSRDMPVEEAAELVAGARRAALNMFPGKELAYDILYKPRLQRLMREKYRIQ
jgi:hypothetical protein